MAEMYFEIPATLRVKATGPYAGMIEKIVKAADYEDFAPDAFPLTRTGVTLEIETITFPGASEMIETEEDPY